MFFAGGKMIFFPIFSSGMFKGKTCAVFVDKREYGGLLWKQVGDEFQFVLHNIHFVTELEGSHP